MGSEAKYVAGFIAAAVLLSLIFAVSCDDSGEEHYHVPGVSVDIDKGKKRYKPSAPKPAPRFGGSVGRKR